jgi:DEAD/DEAH box helicase domain-containing protein
MAGQAGASAMFGKLVNGELRCVVSTNKLMAGIDIGDLDVSVVSGFQFRFSDMRQMLGRAARKSSGAWVFFGDPNSLEDLYVMDSFPDVFECKNPEACVVSVKNKRLAAAHFRCVNGFLARPWQQEGPAVARLTRWLFPVVGGKPETDGHTDPWKAPPLEGLQMRGANVRDTYGFVFEGSVEAQEDPYKVQERIAFRDFHPGAIVDIGDAVYECTTLTPHPVCRVHVKAVEDLGIRT